MVSGRLCAHCNGKGEVIMPCPGCNSLNNYYASEYDKIKKQLTALQAKFDKVLGVIALEHDNTKVGELPEVKAILKHVAFGTARPRRGEGHLVPYGRC